MQINIEVNETQFTDIMEKSLATLPEEKIQEVILEGMKKYVAESDMIKDLLTDKSAYGSRVLPTTFLLKLVDKMMPTEDLNDIRNEMLSCLRTNYDKVLREAIAQTLVEGMCSYNNDAFRNAVIGIFREHMQERSN